MKFVSLKELKVFLGVSEEVGDIDLIDFLRKIFSEKEGGKREHKIKGINLSTQQVYFLLDLYEKDENRVFSDWVESDESLLSFLRDDLHKKHNEIKTYEGHLLEHRYAEFVAHFLLPKLKSSVSFSIDNENLDTLLYEVELSNLLPKRSMVEIQQEVHLYIKDLIEGAEKRSDKAIQRLLSKEFTLLINGMDESFYADKISFVESVKRLLEQKEELVVAGTKRLKELNLNNAHRKEVDRFVSERNFSNRKRGRISLAQLLRTPLFYATLLIIAVLIFVLTPKDQSEPYKIGGDPKKRSGLDSLTLAEMKGADTLLGYKEDSVVQDLEQLPSPLNNDQYQVVDSEDTLQNKLARALHISMAADYEIQDMQGDTKDCSPLTLGQKQSFQMEGVIDLNKLVGGSNHKLINESPYDLYVLLFENTEGGKVYGSFVPAKGRLDFNYFRGMRMLIYSGKNLTRFNPLLHKNGGYGSVVYAKKIDDRFIAHFCELNIFNLQFMSKSWKSVKKGDGITTVVGGAGALKLVSETFEE